MGCLGFLSRLGAILRVLVGSLRNDDENSNDSATNQDMIAWMRRKSRAARAARSLVQFFDMVCQSTT